MARGPSAEVQRAIWRRRWWRRVLWMLAGLMVLASVGDHLGWFGYHNDWRMDKTTVRIRRATAGDTVEIGNGVELKLLGVGWDRLGWEYLAGLEGKDFTLRFAPGGTRDRRGRLIGYLYQGDVCLNEEMIRRGAAYADASVPHPLDGSFRVAEAEARRKREGRWRN